MTSCSLLVMDSTRRLCYWTLRAALICLLVVGFLPETRIFQKSQSVFRCHGWGKMQVTKCALVLWVQADFAILTTEISSKLVITGPFGLKFSAVLPETQTFRKCYRGLSCNGGGGCNIRKYTRGFLWRIPVIVHSTINSHAVTSYHKEISSLLFYKNLQSLGTTCVTG